MDKADYDRELMIVAKVYIHCNPGCTGRDIAYVMNKNKIGSTTQLTPQQVTRKM